MTDRACIKPLWIRLNHEMNLDIYPWGGSVNGNTLEQVFFQKNSSEELLAPIFFPSLYT